MDYQYLNNEIKTNNVKNLYYFNAKENYIAYSMLSLLKKHILDNETEGFNLTVFEDKKTDFSSFEAVCETFPILSDKRLIVVKGKENVKGLISNKNLVNYLKDIPFFSVVVFYCDFDLDKRTSFYKEIVKHGQIIDFEKFSPYQLESWVRKKLKENNVKLANDSIKYFIEVSQYHNKDLNIDLGYFIKEIDKLSSYSKENEAIDIALAKKIITPNINSNVFNLTNALSCKDTQRAFKVLNDLIYSKSNFPSILGITYKQLENILICKEGRDNCLDERAIATKYSMNPYSVKIALKDAKNFTKKELNSLIIGLNKLDYLFKSGKIDEKSALFILTYGVSSRNLLSLINESI